MSFRTFRSEGKEVILNTDRIIGIMKDNEGRNVLIGTDQFTLAIEDSEDEIRRKLGVRNPTESRVGFKS